MDAERWRIVGQAFRAALEAAPEDRGALLDELSSGDATLRAEVESLLEAHGAAGDFLESPPASAPRETIPARDPYVDTKLGPYQVVRLLGRGGLGSVYLALRADDEFQQRVALKVLRPGLEGEEIARRFRTERQILAALDHPNIARLFDGGSTESGLPYFVMEYVEGKSIDEYCAAHRLPLRERLGLFRAVCSAVRYAHRNLVVHRDIKPSNILVTGGGTVKLLDFGIAKLLNPELSISKLEPTAASHRLMTPDFASPEQALGESVTTATDVYSLGVLLYLLLTGQRPYHVSNPSPAEILRVICTKEPEPPSLSIRKWRPETGEDPLPALVRADGPPSRLQRRLTGDLDNIVLLALRKEPELRYASVEQLEDDIGRHLGGHPVQAREPTLLYRAGKFLSRHRLAAATVAAFVLASLAFGLVMGLQSQHLEAERDRAERVKSFLVELLEAADPVQARGRSITLVEVLDQGAHRLTTELSGQPQTQADLLSTLGVTYTRLGSFERAEDLLEQSLAVRRRLFGAEHAQVAKSLNDLADLRLASGDLDAAESLLQEALDMRRALYGGSHGEIAETLNDLGKVLHGKGQLEAAEARYREALAMRRRYLGPHHVEVAETLNNLAVLLWQRGELAQAEPLHRQALGMREQLLGTEHIEVSESLNNLAALLRDRGKLAEARDSYERALTLRKRHLGEGHPRVATTLNNLAGVLQDQGDLEAAETLYLSALELYREKFGEQHPYVAGTLRNLATLLQQQGRHPEAEEHLRKSLGILRKTVGPRHALTAWSAILLADLLAARGAFSEAEPLATEALDVLGSDLPRDHWKVATAQSVRAAVLLGLGHREEAEPLLLESRRKLRNATSGQALRALRSVERRLAELEGSG